MEEQIKLKQELERVRFEFDILYEISNAMRTTLDLDEILYIILTGVTAHTALGFNRACLFLINEKDRLIEGKMGIGPESGHEANLIWTQIEQNKMDFEDLINSYKVTDEALKSGFNKQVKALKLPLDDKQECLLSMAILEGMPLHITRESIEKYRYSKVVGMLQSDEMVLVPLKTKDKVNGIIVADNFITKKPITKDNLRMFILLANQAGLAIENSQLYEKTLVRSQMDSLTELWNHGYFQFLLHAELENAKRNKTNLNLVIMDIDDFKVYNDALGHQAGDGVLKELAKLLHNHSRKIDHVCRYGGEEFTIILPETQKEEALLIAERLRKDIEQHAFLQKEIFPKNKLTVSLGVSAYPQDGESPQELINSADKMLYQAKQKGKNITCC